MDKQEIRNHILKTEWESWHESGHFASLWGSVFPYDVSEQEADNIMEAVRELETEGYFCLDFQGELTRKGIAYTEEQNLVDADKVLYHRELRRKILSFLFQLHESKGRSEIHITQLAAELNIDMNRLDEEYRVLTSLGYAKHPNPSISREGIEYWKEQLLLKSLKSEFFDLENLQNINPQQRGRELERLISEVLEFAGFHAEANVTTSYEQIDVAIHRIREFYYLIECKWEKKPIEADVVDKLFGKLSRRATTYGILMSMSGFTKGCVDCVKDFTSQKLILLFGKSDIEEIIAFPNSFDSLLNEKHKELVLRRNVVWK